MHAGGGSVVIEARQPQTSRGYRVHWAGAHGGDDPAGCGTSADLLLNQEDIEILAMAAGGYGVASRRLAANSLWNARALRNKPIGPWADVLLVSASRQTSGACQQLSLQPSAGSDLEHRLVGLSDGKFERRGMTLTLEGVGQGLQPVGRRFRCAEEIGCSDREARPVSGPPLADAVADRQVLVLVGASVRVCRVVVGAGLEGQPVGGGRGRDRRGRGR